MRKQSFGILLLMLIGLLLTSLLFGQTTPPVGVLTNTIVVDDINGPDGDLLPVYALEGDEVDLTITSFEYHFNFVCIEVIDKSVSLLPLSINYFKPYDGDVRTDFYTGNLELNKTYEVKIIFMTYAGPQMVKRFQIVRRE